MKKKEEAPNQVLYRKYRPETFKDVIGQDHVIKILENALKSGKIAHAYLFSGSRGTGKTSVARIFADEVGTSENDLYEIDAASNNGVEDVRDLRENVRTLPFDSKYKVYILDEVHMLSKAAFNALLKTLEEPPEHVIFILATTELEKVPETIISRCQTYTFKKPTESILEKLSIDIAKKEGFTLEGGGARLIALLGDGSFRDTEGILEKVFAYSKDKKISAEEIEEVTGAPSPELVRKYTEALLLGDKKDGLLSVKAVVEKNADMKVFAKLILALFRLLLLARVAPEVKKELAPDIAEADESFIGKMVKEHPEKIVSATLLRLIKAYDMQRYAFIPELPLELALVEIIGENSEV